MIDHAYDCNNIFARILRSELPCKAVYEDEYVLAFEDIAPAAPVHVLVIPKGQYVSFADFSAHAPPETIAAFFQRIGQVAEKLGLVKDGYRVILNQGRDGGQVVPHLHAHILAGRQLGKLAG